jgi:transcriptional enhancer factor
MQVQRRHPSFAQPARTGFEVHRVDASTQSQDILQARPADHSNQYYNTSLSPRPGQLNSSGSMSHTDKQQEATTVYHSGSTHLQYMGLTAFGVEKPEKHIQTELEQLYNTLARADRYQKYREKQPALTPAEVIVRDAADKQERESREAEGIPQSHKDGTVWPDFMEYAFWRGKASRFCTTTLNSLIDLPFA